LCFVAVSYEKGKHLLRISYEVCSIAYTKVNSSISPAIVSENGIVSGLITKQKEIMNVEEAADSLGISKNTLYEWVV